MIPTDETRQPKHPVLAPPSLADDANLKWQIEDLHYQIQVCNARIEANRRQSEHTNGTPEKLEPPPL